MIKKFLFSAIFTISFTTIAFGLSSEEVAQCKLSIEKYGSGQSQIVSADAAKEAATMLALCGQANICQKELLTMNGCQKKLLSWEANPPITEKKSAKKATQQKENTTVNKPKPATTTTPTTQPFEKSPQQPKKEIKKNNTQPINWF